MNSLLFTIMACCFLLVPVNSCCFFHRNLGLKTYVLWKNIFFLLIHGGIHAVTDLGPVLGRIFDVESEFAVKNPQIRRPEAKN